MTERIEYDVTDEGLRVSVPPRMGERYFDMSARGNYQPAVLYAKAPPKQRVVEIHPSDDSVVIDLNFKKVQSIRGEADKATATLQLATTHRQIVERASGDERSDIVEVNYSNSPNRIGLHAMSAFLHLRGEIDPQFDGLVQADMRRAASFLVGGSDEAIRANVRSQLSDDFEIPRLIANREEGRDMAAPDSYNRQANFLTLIPHNITDHAQQLVCLTGLASFAKHRG